MFWWLLADWKQAAGDRKQAAGGRRQVAGSRRQEAGGRQVAGSRQLAAAEAAGKKGHHSLAACGSSRQAGRALPAGRQAANSGRQ